MIGGSGRHTIDLVSKYFHLMRKRQEFDFLGLFGAKEAAGTGTKTTRAR